MHSWMRQHKTGMIYSQFPPKQKIQIQRTRPPTLLQGSVPSVATLKCLKTIQKAQSRTLRRRHFNTLDKKNRIAIARLIGWPADGSSVMQCRPSETELRIPPTDKFSLELRPHGKQRLARRASWTGLVRPQRHRNTGVIDGGHQRDWRARTG